MRQQAWRLRECREASERGRGCSRCTTLIVVVLCVAYIQVVPVQLCADEPEPPGQQQIRILSGMGWGDGRHPTTRLCLEFLSMEGVICGGERVIDYGTGSGVLSIGETDGRPRHVAWRGGPRWR